MRKLKTIGITIVAMFALTAVAASAAQASAFTSEGSPTTLSSEATSTQTLRVNSSVAAQCEQISLTNSEFTGTSVSTVTVTPNYHNAGGAKCNLEPFGEAEVVTNACTYTFHAASSEVNIGCASGKAIEIKAPGCTVKVGAQTTSGVSFANGSGFINLTANVPAAFTASGLLCGTFGVPSSGTATYTGTVKVTGSHPISWDA